MSKARKVSRIFEGELKSDELTLKDGSGVVQSQKDANVLLNDRIDELDAHQGDHEHSQYAAADHSHDDNAESGHNHDDAYASKVHEHSDLAKRDHEHSQYITTVDSDLADEKIQRDIDEHKSTNHRFLELSGGHMDNGADIIWPPNTGTIIGLNKAVDDTSPVRKKEFDEAISGGDSDLKDQVEDNTARLDKEIEDRQKGDASLEASKSDKTHKHDDAYQPKGDYADANHTHEADTAEHEHPEYELKSDADDKFTQFNEDLNQEIKDRKAGDADLDSKKSDKDHTHDYSEMVDAAKEALGDLDDKIDAVDEKVEAVDGKVDQEIQDRTDGDAAQAARNDEQDARLDDLEQKTFNGEYKYKKGNNKDNVGVVEITKMDDKRLYTRMNIVDLNGQQIDMKFFVENDPISWIIDGVRWDFESGSYNLSGTYLTANVYTAAGGLADFVAPENGAEVIVNTPVEHEFPDPVYMGDEEPENPKEGDLWYDTNRLEMFIRYDGGWITTTALGARVAEGEAKQREIEEELTFTRTRLAGLQGDSLAYGMWRLSLANQNPRDGDFVFLTSTMQVTHSLSETSYMQINATDSQGKTVSFTDIRGGDVVRITEPGDNPVTLYIKKQNSSGLFEVFVQEGMGRPRSNENHFVDFIRNDLRTSALRNDPIFRFRDRETDPVLYDGDCYWYPHTGTTAGMRMSFKTLYGKIWGSPGWDTGYKDNPPTFPEGISNDTSGIQSYTEGVQFVMEDVATGIQLGHYQVGDMYWGRFMYANGTLKPNPETSTTRTFLTTARIDKNMTMRFVLPEHNALVRIRVGGFL